MPLARKNYIVNLKSVGMEVDSSHMTVGGEVSGKGVKSWDKNTVFHCHWTALCSCYFHRVVSGTE